MIKIIKLGTWKILNLDITFLHSLSSGILDRIESHIIKVVPFFHVRVSSTISSDFPELEYAILLNVKSLSLVNFLAFFINALD